MYPSRHRVRALTVLAGAAAALLLAAQLGAAAAAEVQKFTLVNVVFDGTKLWLPSSLIVHQGDEVELTLINKLDEPHGFKIEALGIEEVVQPKAKTTLRFTASQAGVQTYFCHLHPPHLGGQILVLGQ